MGKKQPPRMLGNLDTMRHLAMSGALQHVSIAYGGKGWVVVAWNDQATYLLKTDRGALRIFKTMEAAAKAIKSFGMNQIVLQLDNWNPNQGEL